MSDETKVNPEEPERALVSRRKFLGGVAGAGIGGLALAGILAACGQDDDGGEAAAPRPARSRRRRRLRVRPPRTRASRS